MLDVTKKEKEKEKEEKSISELLEKLEGNPITKRWDMVVVYEESVLNSALESNFIKKEGVINKLDLGDLHAPYKTEYDANSVDIGDVLVSLLTVKITVSLSFTLNQPALSFSSNLKNTATLNSPIQDVNERRLKLNCDDFDIGESIRLDELEKEDVFYKEIEGKVIEISVVEIVDEEDEDEHTCHVKGSYYIKSDNILYKLKKITPSNKLTEASKENPYSLEITTPIKAIKGSDCKTSGLISFDKKVEESHIVLDFDTSGGSGSSIDIRGDSDQRLLKTYPEVLNELRNYFIDSVDSVDYKLTSISNIKADGGVDLTPKSFIFNTQVVDSVGLLSIFIEIDESGNPQGDQSNLDFLYKSEPFSPLIHGHNTSLLFSREFMSNYYLPSSLDKESSNKIKNAKGVGTSLDPVEVAADYEGDKKNIDVDIPVNTFNGLGQTYDSITLDKTDISTLPFGFRFKSNSKIQYLFDYQKKSNIVLHGSYTSPATRSGPGHTSYTNDSYEIIATAKIRKSKELKDLGWCLLENGDIKMTIEGVFKDDYDITVSADTLDSNCVNAAKNKLTRQVKDDIGDALPVFNLKMNTLQTVAETNLLFNGRKLFKLNVDTGMFSPLDVITFGGVHVDA